MDHAPPPDKFDTPWKNILEGYFQNFLAFFLPEAHDGIDWQRGYEFLDKELAQITREAKIGDRHMDKLVKVWQLDGNERWVLIHIEIQGDREANFAARMFTYHYRAYDLHQQPVVGLAILTDEERGWRPSDYDHSLWGMSLHYRFNMVKLVDYSDQPSLLETSDNPFAMVTLAHLQAKMTKHHPEDRYQAKWQLIRGLYQHGFSGQQIRDLFGFIDWVLMLSKEADQQFWQELAHLEEIQKMPYITSVERIGMEKGVARTFLRQIEYRFGSVPDWVRDKVAHADINILDEWAVKVLDAKKIEGIFQEDLLPPQVRNEETKNCLV